jgi:hypothetical protein
MCLLMFWYRLCLVLGSCLNTWWGKWKARHRSSPKQEVVTIKATQT